VQRPTQGDINEILHKNKKVRKEEIYRETWSGVDRMGTIIPADTLAERKEKRV